MNRNGCTLPADPSLLLTLTLHSDLITKLNTAMFKAAQLRGPVKTGESMADGNNFVQKVLSGKPTGIGRSVVTCNKFSLAVVVTFFEGEQIAHAQQIEDLRKQEIMQIFAPLEQQGIHDSSLLCTLTPLA